MGLIGQAPIRRIAERQGVAEQKKKTPKGVFSLNALVGRDGFEPSTKRLKGCPQNQYNQCVMSVVFPERRA